jgi:hypothetical protein
MAQANIVAVAGTPILRTTARSELKGAIPSEGRCGYSQRRIAGCIGNTSKPTLIGTTGKLPLDV